MIWYQEGQRVMVCAKEGEIFFDMPDYFKLQEIDPALLRLAEVLLFGYWHRELFDFTETRSKGDRIGLAYSGGADSTATYSLLPRNKVRLMYHKRAGLPMKKLKDDNAFETIRKNEMPCIVIPSNLEAVRKYYGLPAGFQSDMVLESTGVVGLAPATALVLLADYLELGYISLGVVLHALYIDKESGKFSAYHETDDWKLWKGVFERAGLDLILPVASCFSLGSLTIAEQSGLFYQSCLRGTGGEGCGECYKCYLKAILKGNPIKVNHEVTYNVKENKIRRAMLLSGRNRYGLNLPELSGYELDTSYFGGYYKPALELVPIEYRNEIEEKVSQVLPVMDSKKFERIAI